jgi:hypothetical protein
VKSASSRGLGIEVAQPLSTGTPIKIALEDDLLMGEVIYCRKEDKTFYIGIELEQVLSGLAELARIMQGFREEWSSEEGHHAADQTPHKHEQKSR